MPAPINEQHFGLAAWYGPLTAMPRPHSHGEIELNFVESGALTYLFGGAEITVPAGCAAAFWAAIPHHEVGWRAGTRCAWLTLPLAHFLGWRLDCADRLLNGDLLLAQPESPALSWGRFASWADDLRAHPHPGDGPAVVLLEAEAYLRRLCWATKGEMPGEARPTGGGSGGSAAALMARMMSARYAEDLTVTEIAAAAGLHPNYATTVFRAAYGLSLIAYLTRCRVAHAQRLLLTGDLGVIEVGYAAGFRSVSRFYQAFERACGEPPGRYRARLRRELPPREGG